MLEVLFKFVDIFEVPFDALEFYPARALLDSHFGLGESVPDALQSCVTLAKDQIKDCPPLVGRPQIRLPDSGLEFA